MNTHLPKLHLVMEIRLSEIVGTSGKVHPPCDLWLLSGLLPADVELDEPHAMVYSDPQTKKPVRHDDIKLFDLSSEEFASMKQSSSAVRIAAGLELAPQAIPAVMSVLAALNGLGYAVAIYETCDY